MRGEKRRNELTAGLDIRIKKIMKETGETCINNEELRASPRAFLNLTF